MIVVSDSKEDQLITKLQANSRDHGVFSYSFWKLIEENPSLIIKEIEVKNNQSASKGKQCLTYEIAPQTEFNEPTVTHRERKFHSRGHRRVQKDE
ncbi:hypothetical protein M9Y10_012871 [Tritrichomonas musculus]|uniref:Uncharacterized protein n=1 Tax=Tritrichomonas musculus TaxID=1915356 RepID=A0ABR2IE47_9EUKA